MRGTVLGGGGGRSWNRYITSYQDVISESQASAGSDPLWTWKSDWVDYFFASLVVTLYCRLLSLYYLTHFIIGEDIKTIVFKSVDHNVWIK